MKYIYPLRDNILVTLIEATRKSGIHIPESVKQKSQRGKVLAIGPDQKDIAIREEIIFDLFTAHRYIDEDDKEYYFVEYEDVLGTLR